MPKIVAIVTSPRGNGNSEAILDAMTDGAMGLFTNEIELVNINKLKFFSGCQACERCKTAGHCVINDELITILESIREADGLIISTPLYFGEVSALFKVLQDRMYSFFNADLTPNIPAGKKVAVIVSCSGDTDRAEHVAKKVESFFVDMLKCVSFGTVVYSDEMGAKPAAFNKDVLVEAKTIGKKFYR